MTKYMQKDSIVLISKSDIQELLPDVSVATALDVTAAGTLIGTAVASVAVIQTDDNSIRNFFIHLPSFILLRYKITHESREDSASDLPLSDPVKNTLYLYKRISAKNVTLFSKKI